MNVTELYSMRQKRLRGETVDVFTYDGLPAKLKYQIWTIAQEAIGEIEIPYRGDWYPPYDRIVGTLCREYGMEQLSSSGLYSETELKDFFLKTDDVDKNLDVVELLFKFIENEIEELEDVALEDAAELAPKEALEELNCRFRMAGIGYAFENGEIIRVDSTYVHAEITKPTIALLLSDTFASANEEYMTAHEHYRHGRNQECIVNCLKAFESTMKIICLKRGWDVDRKATAGQLINVCLKNKLVPDFLEPQNRALQNIMISSVPTIRNNAGGHGQGPIKREVDDKMAKYCLNLTGANIIFLVDQSKVE